MAALTPRQVFLFEGHLWFVATDPLPKKGKVLCLNFSTHHSAASDHDCILDTKDFSGLDGPSCIVYSMPMIFDIEKLSAGFAKGLIPSARHSHIPEATFQKIREIGKKVLDEDVAALL